MHTQNDFQARTHEKKDNSYTVTIPRFSAPKNISYTQILTVLLIVASFFIGSLYTKVQMLEKNGNTQAVAGQNTQQAAPQAAAPNQPQPTLGKQNVENGNYPPRGDANAKVTLVAFEDFRCPFCKQFTEQTMPQIQKEYVDTGKVKVYYRNYQFLGPASVTAGNAGECANEQGKFWEFHDYMYKNQPSESDTSMYTTDKLTNIAGNLGMDTAQFTTCLDNKKYDKNVSDDLAAGQKAGVTATPTIFINGTPIVGAEAYSVFKQYIDQELAK